MTFVQHSLLRCASRAALGLLAATALACSFSHSSESSSDSSNNSSESSSHSSSPGQNNNKDATKTSFDRDVEQYTLAFLQAGGRDDEAFLAGIGDLARQYGVSDWESELSTWEAIGRGLARSHASAAQRSAYQLAWTGGDSARETAMAKGFSSIP
ncbi:MAG TPA: hypothetical protein VMW19_01635 [Myxococcota bacterium]|nr:hypothetical protein [Myxococcota bacterium]